MGHNKLTIKNDISNEFRSFYKNFEKYDFRKKNCPIRD